MMEPLQILESDSHGGSAMLLAATCAVAALGGLAFGYALAVPSGALPHLRDRFLLSSAQQELAVGAALAGALVASLLGGPLLDRLGRRSAVACSGALLVTGSAFLACAPSYAALLGGRAVVGVAIAASSVATCVYVAEVAHPRRRGALVSAYELGVTGGVLAAYAANLVLGRGPGGTVGGVAPWRWMFGLCCVPALAQVMLLVACLPASPSSLLRCGQAEAAERTLRRILGQQDVSAEIDALRSSLEMEKQYSVLDLLRRKDSMRTRMLIGGGLVAFQQLTGQPTVLFYAASVFRAAGYRGEASVLLASVGLGLVKVAATSVAVAVVDRVGRRRSLLAGSVAMALSLAAVAAATSGLGDAAGGNTSAVASGGNDTMGGPSWANWTHVEDGGVSVGPTARWASLLAILAFVGAFSLSYGPMTWVLLSEIFPAGIKGRAIAVTTSLNWGINLVVSLVFLDIIECLGLSMTFLLYAIMGVVSVVFVNAFVPETKGQTLEEISQQLNSTHTRALWCCGDAKRRQNREEVQYRRLDGCAPL
ncbi:solute carrier family 2, facilitated glucose transporter member 10 [Petromyzon marinus]|uniref:solute carrier family 2, facilitated glucose transporter member 10 n=1 Tax=Petromyzon marinus TaxID=7757 RepID=UPI003F73114C